jgi:hypothetical protein
MNKTMSKTSVLGRILKNPYTIIGAIIMVIGISHFTLQIFFIQEEKLQSVETALEQKIENETVVEKPKEQIIRVEPEVYEVKTIEVKKVKVITMPETVKVVPRRQKETVPARKPVKTKEVQETRAARLRRAERILTGV